MSTILIAEDNATNRELFRAFLEARGYTVVEACDGREALRMIEQAQPDILLLDIGMPVLDGFAVVRAIRENPRVAALPVLAVLSKPINAKSLAEELEHLLSERDARNTVPKRSPAASNRKKQAAKVAGSDGR
jgi:CheY-like chemotaxis protein